jgi:membrane protease YdiL (CAAX protease family)
MVLKYITEFTNIIRETYHQEEKGRPIDTQTIAISVLAALSLLLIQFIAKTGNFLRFLQEFGLHSAVDFFNQLFTPSEYGNLIQLLWFASFSLFFYLIFPMFFMRLFFKQRMSDYGLKLKGAFIYGKFYIIFMIFMVPIIMFVATFPSFQNTYPFYRLPYNTPLWSTILIWEVFYFLQFIGTEFFFRGFLIHGLKHRFGFYVIFVSMIPYCMIHFQKPFLEALGSILAGLILGVMSLRTNSVVMGIMLHYGVALLMDICAILMGNRSFLG